ncbi:MAG: transcriptional regulator [Rhodoferax sp.]|nr:transcriptional regulator [Rhodoferax sp.]
MNIADLKTFEAVARHGSMNKAASELNTVQSNVTVRIRALEDALGMPLFQRHARGVTPTPAGQRVLPFVGRLTRLMAEVKSAALDEGRPSGALSLGSLETTMAMRLSPLLVEFSGTYPDVQLVVTPGTTARLVQDVVASRLDGAFVAGPVSHPELLQELMFSEELVLVTSPATGTLKALKELPELKTISFQLGCSYRQRLESFLADAGIVVSRRLEFGSLDAIVSCVSAGIGVSLLPQRVVQAAADAGMVRLIALPRAQAKVATLFVRRRDSYVSSALTAFLAMTRRVHATPGKRAAKPRKRPA